MPGPLDDLSKLKNLGKIPKADGTEASDLAEHAGGVMDAAGTRMLEGMASIERTAQALINFGIAQDRIVTALLDIEDLVHYDGKNFHSKAREFLMELAANSQEREKLIQRVVGKIDAFRSTINSVAPIHSQEVDDLLKSLETLSRSLLASNAKK